MVLFQIILLLFLLSFVAILESFNSNFEFTIPVACSNFVVALFVTSLLALLAFLTQLVCGCDSCASCQAGCTGGCRGQV